MRHLVWGPERLYLIFAQLKYFHEAHESAAP